METLIDQDFEFNKYSLIYGKFLQEVHESCPDITVSDAVAFYKYKDLNTIFVHVAVPEPIAVVLKLRFGVHLRTRLPPETEPNWGNIEDEKMNSLAYWKKLYYKEELYKKNSETNNKYIRDYTDILRAQEIENLKMEMIYLDPKKLSVPRGWLDEK